ncbi:uncharacterized protein LOC132559782 [Ylistrum balloti]|uniref:uncharacterized protein LOC132559782 n=1 Tax=Ylistrum balloti TaxID=509963 RepID=UPI002905F4D8|nr:uncharacterized protein LOC132559782 [Ylistrum balloti]
MMANAELFSDEFFGFAVPDYAPSPEPEHHYDGLTDGINRLSVTDSVLTPTGGSLRPSSGPTEHEMTRNEIRRSLRPTSGPTEHEMKSIEVDSPNSNNDTSINDVRSDIHDSMCSDKDNLDGYTPDLLDGECNSDFDTSNSGYTNEGGDDCECGSVINENDGCEELKSNIEFQLTQSHKETGGFSVTSRSFNHTIDIHDSSNSHVQYMKLQTGDCLISIKNIDVRHYDHYILVSTLQHIYGEDDGAFKMVIGRKFETDDTGKTELRYIEINVHFEFPTRGEPMPHISVDVVSCTSLTFTKVICVEFKDTKVCWIRSNDQYMSVQNNELTMNNRLTSKSDKNFQFVYTTFHGLEARTVGNTMCPALFFCAFESAASGTFILAMSTNRVGLGGSSLLRRDMSGIRKPDCRFFKVRLISKHIYLLESLVYKDMYLSCNRRGLSMKKGTSHMDDIFRIPRELQFEILTSIDHSLI